MSSQHVASIKQYKNFYGKVKDSLLIVDLEKKVRVSNLGEKYFEKLTSSEKSNT